MNLSDEEIQEERDDGAPIEILEYSRLAAGRANARARSRRLGNQQLDTV